MRRKHQLDHVLFSKCRTEQNSSLQNPTKIKEENVRQLHDCIHPRGSFHLISLSICQQALSML